MLKRLLSKPFSRKSLVVVPQARQAHVQNSYVKHTATPSSARQTNFNAARDMLKSCSNFEEARSLYANVARQQLTLSLSKELLLLFGRTNDWKSALDVFKLVKQKNNHYDWTLMLKLYVNNNKFEMASNLFQEMVQSKVKIDSFSLNYALRAYQHDIAACRNLFSQIDTQFRVQKDAVHWTTMLKILVDANCYSDAKQMFDEMLVQTKIRPDATMIATVLSAHADDLDSAINFFNTMEQKYSVSKNAVHLNILIQTLARHKRQDLIMPFVKGHVQTPTKRGIIPTDTTVSCLLEAFQHDLTLASEIFYSMKEKFGISPNSHHYAIFIKNLIQNGDIKLALSLIDKLKELKIFIHPSMVTLWLQKGFKHRPAEAWRFLKTLNEKYAVVLNDYHYSALIELCKSSFSVDIGNQVHSAIMNSAHLHTTEVFTTLMDMHGKFGNCDKARQTFDSMKHRDVIAYTTLINCFAVNGLAREALQVYHDMTKSNYQPNRITFSCLLLACSHSGMVEEAQYLFSQMQNYSIVPDMQHINTLVDCYARSGKLDEAEELLASFSKAPDIVSYMSILGACRTLGDAQRAERMFDAIMGLNQQEAAAYVMMANIYAADNRFEDRDRIRELMKQRGIKKNPGITTLSVNEEQFDFVAQDEKYLSMPQVKTRLDYHSAFIKQAIGKVDTSGATKQYDSEEKKEESLCGHSERIALAYASVFTPPGSPIHLKKNLRVCGSCHAATKVISSLEKREIIVRDNSRFHHFKDGKCSCNDFF